jgi:hypothetical protein
MATYTFTPSGDAILCMSVAELKGLMALAMEGYAGLLVDSGASAGYIGSPSQVQAAERAYATLQLLHGTALKRERKKHHVT